VAAGGFSKLPQAGGVGWAGHGARSCVMAVAGPAPVLLRRSPGSMCQLM